MSNGFRSTDDRHWPWTPCIQRRTLVHRGSYPFAIEHVEFQSHRIEYESVEEIDVSHRQWYIHYDWHRIDGMLFEFQIIDQDEFRRSSFEQQYHQTWLVVLLFAPRNGCISVCLFSDRQWCVIDDAPSNDERKGWVRTSTSLIRIEHSSSMIDVNWIAQQ